MSEKPIFTEPVPPIDELRQAGPLEIANEAAEHAKDMEFARTDPDQSARNIVNRYDKKRQSELDTAYEEESTKARSARLEEIRQRISQRASGPRVIGSDGQLTTLEEHADQVKATREGAL